MTTLSIEDLENDEKVNLADKEGALKITVEDIKTSTSKEFDEEETDEQKTRKRLEKMREK